MPEHKATGRTKTALTLERLDRSFTGRGEELGRLEQDFLSRGVRAVILHGPGGIGKTVIASRAAEMLSGSFDYIYSFDCRGGLKAEEMLSELSGFLRAQDVGEFDNVVRSPMPVELKADFFAQILNKINCLIILDNFDSLLIHGAAGTETAEPSLKQALSSIIRQCEKGTRFIFTSRYAFPLLEEKSSAQIDEIFVGEFSENEAFTFMDRFPETAALDGETRERIFQSLGGHPYALRLFALHAGKSPVEDVLSAIGEQKESLPALIEKTFNSLSDRAKALLGRASVFTRPVPLPALKWMMEGYDADGYIESEFTELDGWGVIETAGDSFRIRRVIRDFIHMNTPAEEWKRWLTTGAEFLAHHAKDTGQFWYIVNAHELYFEAGKFPQAGEIVANISETLYKWGMTGLAKDLNKVTSDTTDGLSKAAACYNLGMLHHSEGKYDAALEYYRESLSAFEGAENRHGISSTLHQLGMVHQDMGEDAKAMECYYRSMEVAEELGDRKSVAYTLGQVGIVHGRHGEYDKAIEAHLRCLDISEDMKDAVSAARALHQLGIMHSGKGEYARSREYHTRSLKAFEDQGDRLGVSRVLVQLGIVLQKEGEFGTSLEHLNRSLEISEKLGDMKGAASTRIHLGKTYLLKGEHDKAAEQFTRSLQQYRDMKDGHGYVGALHQLAVTHRHKGELDEAMEKLEVCLRMNDELKDRHGSASVLGEMGSICAEKEDHRNAVKNLLISLSIFEGLDSPYKAVAVEDLHALELRLGREKFKSLYEEVLEELKSKEKGNGK